MHKKIDNKIERISIADILQSPPILLDTRKPSQSSTVQHYLLARAVELALKAFLSANGITLEELAGRNYRHSLVKLLRAAENRGITGGCLPRLGAR